VQLRTTIERTGATTTGIRLTDEHLEQLGGGKRPRVVVTLGEHTYRTTVGSHDGSPFISVSAAVRDAAGVAGGDEVDVTIEPDTEPVVIEVPDDLAAALADAPAERAFFEGLTPSQRKAYVTWITGAKQQATRDRRVAQAIEKLAAGRKQP
jgi:hypothetical protein